MYIVDEVLQLVSETEVVEMLGAGNDKLADRTKEYQEVMLGKEGH
jgi:hypothetical protein